ncbi:hypothetical protein ADUPG1_009201, partial [Aduncisulcus paluster]
ECNSSTGLCECNTNWSGDTCSEYTPDGSCLYGVSNGSGCTCQLNYSGDYCQCKNNCSLHGLCNEWGCECEDGFSGGDCSEARVPEIDTDSIYIDYAEAVIGFSFLYEVTISGINETDVTFDCSLLIEEYGESGSFGATVKYFDSSSICKRNSDLKSFLLYPGIASWISSEMTFNLLGDTIIDKVTHKANSEQMSVYLDPSLFPATDDLTLPDSLVPEFIFLCQSGSYWSSHGLILDVSPLQHTGWGRIFYVWSVVLEDGQTNSTLESINMMLNYMSSTPPASSSTTKLSSYSSSVEIPATYLSQLASDSTLESITLKLSATNLFHPVWTEKEFSIDLVRNSTDLYLTVPSFPHDLYLDRELIIAPSVTCSTCSAGGMALLDSYCEVESISWNWKCLNPSAQHSLTFDTPVVLLEKDSLQSGEYSCNVEVEFNSVSNKKIVTFNMIDPPLTLEVSDAGMPVQQQAVLVSIINDDDEEEHYSMNRNVFVSASDDDSDETIETDKHLSTLHRTANPGDYIRLAASVLSTPDGATISYYWIVTRGDNIVISVSGSELSFFIPSYVQSNTMYVCTAYAWSDVTGSSYTTNHVYIHVLKGDRRTDMDWTDDRMLGMTIQGNLHLEEGNTMRLRAIPHGYSQLDALSFTWSLDLSDIDSELLLKIANTRLADTSFESFTLEESHLSSIIVIEGQELLDLCDAIGVDEPCFAIEMCDSVLDECVDLRVCISVERSFSVVYPVVLDNHDNYTMECGTQYCLSYSGSKEVTSTSQLYFDVSGDLTSTRGDLLSQEVQCEDYSLFSTTQPKANTHDPTFIMLMLGNVIVTSVFNGDDSSISFPCSFMYDTWLSYTSAGVSEALSFTLDETDITAFAYSKNKASTVLLDIELLTTTSSGSVIDVMSNSLFGVMEESDTSASKLDIFDYESVKQLIKYPFTSYTNRLLYCEAINDTTCLVHTYVQLYGVGKDILHILTQERASKGSTISDEELMRNQAIRFLLFSQLYRASLRITPIIIDEDADVFLRVHAFSIFLDMFMWYIDEKMNTVPDIYGDMSIYYISEIYYAQIIEEYFPVIDDGFASTVYNNLKLEGDEAGSMFIDVLPNGPLPPNDIIRQALVDTIQNVVNSYFVICNFGQRTSIYMNVIVAFADMLPRLMDTGELSTQTDAITFARRGGIDMYSSTVESSYCDLLLSFNGLFDEEEMIVYNEYSTLFGCPLTGIQDAMLNDFFYITEDELSDEELEVFVAKMGEQTRSIPIFFTFRRMRPNSITQTPKEDEGEEWAVECDNCFIIRTKVVIPKPDETSTTTSDYTFNVDSKDDEEETSTTTSDYTFNVDSKDDEEETTNNNTIFKRTKQETELVILRHDIIYSDYPHTIRFDDSNPNGWIRIVSVEDEEGEMVDYYEFTVSEYGVYIVYEETYEVEVKWVTVLFICVCIVVGIGIIGLIVACMVTSRKKRAARKKRKETNPSQQSYLAPENDAMIGNNYFALDSFVEQGKILPKSPPSSPSPSNPVAQLNTTTAFSGTAQTYHSSKSTPVPMTSRSLQDHRLPTKSLTMSSTALEHE